MEPSPFPHTYTIDYTGRGGTYHRYKIDYNRQTESFDVMMETSPVPRDADRKSSWLPVIE